MVLLGLLWTTGCSISAKSAGGQRVVSSGRDAREIYQHGQLMIRRGAFEKAQSDFQELRNFHRDDPLSVRAQLALADIHFRRGELEEARYAYQEFAQYYPRHEAMDLVTWRIGQCIWKRAPKLAGRDQTPTLSAVRAWTGGGSLGGGYNWTGFEQRYPESEYREDVDRLLARARNRLAGRELFVADFYEGRRAWAAVSGRADEILRLYPGSRYDERAMSMLARSLHAIGSVQEALAVRERLAESYPDSRHLKAVDKALAEEPGRPPEEEIFVRPYRMPGLGEAQPQR
jgi:outer membrane protein assembly factor BamD